MPKAKVVQFRPYRLDYVEGTLHPFKEDVQLFNAGRKWWLYYSQDNCTGSFSSKKKAMAWHNNGGR